MQELIGLEWSGLRGPVHRLFDGEVELSTWTNPASPRKAQRQIIAASSIDVGGRISLTLCCKAAASGKAGLALLQTGDDPVLILHPDGRLQVTDRAESAEVEQIGDGWMKVSVIFTNLGRSLQIGSMMPYRRVFTCTFAAGDQVQWILKSIIVAPLSPLIEDMLPEEESLIFVDVGAFGGLGPKWAVLGANLVPVMFEPQADEAARIQQALRSTNPNAIVHPIGLSDHDGSATLFLTAAPSCCSLHRPKSETLARFPIAEKFVVTGEIEVEVARYDTLHAQGLVPAPDVIKIDCQGQEYDILSGFGALLANVVAIELEVHLIELYAGEKLLSDICTLLEENGFSLLKLVPNHPIGWNKELVEMNAFFLRRDDAALKLIRNGAAKRRIAANVMDAWGSFL